MDEEQLMNYVDNAMHLGNYEFNIDFAVNCLRSGKCIRELKIMQKALQAVKKNPEQKEYAEKVCRQIDESLKGFEQ